MGPIRYSIAQHSMIGNLLTEQLRNFSVLLAVEEKAR